MRSIGYFSVSSQCIQDVQICFQCGIPPDTPIVPLYNELLVICKFKFKTLLWSLINTSWLLQDCLTRIVFWEKREIVFKQKNETDIFHWTIVHRTISMRFIHIFDFFCFYRCIRNKSIQIAYRRARRRFTASYQLWIQISFATCQQNKGFFYWFIYLI